MSEKKAIISDFENIDVGFYNHINDNFNIKARTNRGVVKVPVLWLAAERTHQIKNDRTFRDPIGKVKLPLISIERASVEKDKSFKGAYQANIVATKTQGREYKERQVVVKTRILQEKTRNYSSARGNKLSKGDKSFPDDKFKTVSSKKIVTETLKSPLPIYVKIMYKIVLRCEYQQQMNEMLSPFVSRTGQINSFVFENNGFRYEAFIEGGYDQRNNASSLNEEERMFQSTVNVRVLGYVMGDGLNDPKPSITTEENIVEVKISRERAITDDKLPWKTKDNKYRSI